MEEVVLSELDRRRSRRRSVPRRAEGVGLGEEFTTKEFVPGVDETEGGSRRGEGAGGGGGGGGKGGEGEVNEFA